MPTIKLVNAVLNGNILNGLFNGSVTQEQSFEYPYRPPANVEPFYEEQPYIITIREFEHD